MTERTPATVPAAQTFRVFRASGRPGICQGCKTPMPHNGGIRLYCSKTCRRRRHNQKAV